jgi:hypothetical protein
LLFVVERALFQFRANKPESEALFQLPPTIGHKTSKIAPQVLPFLIQFNGFDPAAYDASYLIDKNAECAISFLSRYGGVGYTFPFVFEVEISQLIREH